MEPPKRKSPTKPPLITPSASPPLTGPFASLPRRVPDCASPLKRQRLLSTPRRTFQDAPSSSSSRPQTPIDVQKERESSKLRLLDVWANLAERYTRRLDEDDIVDIRTGQITRDNGVLRNSRKFEFGALAAPAPGDVTGDEGSDPEEEEDDEYDLDELDAFADPGSDSGELDGGEGTSELKAGGRAVPPVTPLDPVDAEDLREFMDAERKRKELCGSDIDEEECSSLGPDAETEDDDVNVLEEVESSLAEDETEHDDEAREVQQDELQVRTSTGQPASVDMTSEDELDNWDLDEASVVHPVLKKEAEDSDDSDIEIIEPCVFPTLASQTLATNISMGKPQTQSPAYSRSPQKFPRQLHTPPQSQSSSIPSATPTEERFLDLSLSPPPPSSSRSIQSSSHPTSSNRSLPNGITPNKSSSKPSYEKDGRQAPAPKLDLAKLAKGRGSPEKRSLFKSPSNISEHQSEPVSRRGIINRLPKLKPIVLLTPRKASSPKKARAPSFVHQQEDGVSEGDLEFDNPIPSPLPSSKKGKGKQCADTIPESGEAAPEGQDRPSSSKYRKQRRSHGHATLNEESDDPMTLPSSPSKHSRLHEDDYTSASNPAFTPRPSKKTSSSRQEEVQVSRKRKRLSDAKLEYSVETHTVEEVIEGGDNLQRHHSVSSRASTSRLATDGEIRVPKPTKRSSPRKRRSSPESQSGSASESDSYSSASETTKRQHRKSSSARSKAMPLAPHYPHPHGPYNTPHRHVPHTYAPIPDPRAQFIITQAMQQLSALVGAPWAPPHHYMDGGMPHTPSHRSKNAPYTTPTHHPHPYPYVYDPNLSHATMPPDSPDSDSSPEGLNGGRRKSLVPRSRSRGRRVSFMFDEEGHGSRDRSSSPLGKRPSKSNSKRTQVDPERPRQSQGNGKAKAKSLDEESGSENASESDSGRRGRSYARGQTPGPSLLDSSQKKRRGR